MNGMRLAMVSHMEALQDHYCQVYLFADDGIHYVGDKKP